MKVRMKVSLAGTEFSYYHGQEVEVPDKLGEALCSDGRAEPIEPKSKSKAKTNGRAGAERTSAKPADAEER